MITFFDQVTEIQSVNKWPAPQTQLFFKSNLKYQAFFRQNHDAKNSTDLNLLKLLCCVFFS